MKIFKTTLSDDESVTVYNTGAITHIDIPNQEPINTYIPYIKVFDIYLNDITDSISDEDYSRIEKEAINKQQGTS